jgi:catechol 2,3-dioxygenase-like lactoylglutathione lyase family enzyme
VSRPAASYRGNFALPSSVGDVNDGVSALLPHQTRRFIVRNCRGAVASEALILGRDGKNGSRSNAMFSHITLGVTDLGRAEKFYDAIMGVLEHPVLFKVDQALCYGTATGEKLFVLFPYDGKPAHPGNGVHAAFKTDSRAKVDAFYRAALENGGTDEGPPGLRTYYHPNYYGAYVRDPDGNKLQAVCHRKDG